MYHCMQQFWNLIQLKHLRWINCLLEIHEFIVGLDYGIDFSRSSFQSGCCQWPGQVRMGFDQNWQPNMSIWSQLIGQMDPNPEGWTLHKTQDEKMTRWSWGRWRNRGCERSADADLAVQVAAASCVLPLSVLSPQGLSLLPDLHVSCAIAISIRDTSPLLLYVRGQVKHPLALVYREWYENKRHFVSGKFCGTPSW
jgi:hypothetical protein